MARNNLLRSGAFAQRAGVTKKALQVYMDKGILQPDTIDAENGYRYYDAERVPQLEEIIRMREVGLSLDEIKDIIDHKDSLRYLNILYSRLERIDASIEQLEQDRAVLQARVDNQNMFQNPPALRHCFVEYLPRRAYVRFPIPSFRGIPDSGSAWLNALDVVRDELKERAIPIKHFHNVGATFDMDELRDGRIVYTSAVLFPESLDDFDQVEYLSAGYYASMYDQRYMSDGSAISNAVATLMDFINANGYDVCGEYLEDCVAETTMFDFNRMLYVVKEQVPISVSR